MFPTYAQIEQAAYFRWQRRGACHGQHGDDWIAAEKDLIFSLNYRYVARYKLQGPTLWLGKPSDAEASSSRRRCRYCEQSAPAVNFSGPLAIPGFLGNGALRAWDECDDCRASYEEHLAGPFEAWARRLVGPSPHWPPDPISMGALKALIRIGISVMPESELYHFVDTCEWVANPDHALDAAAIDTLGLGCQAYLTPAPIPAGFVALARRVENDAPWPYMLLFLGTGRVVLQTHLPLCPRDEDLETSSPRGPELSMSLGQGHEHRASLAVFAPLAALVGRGRLTPALGA